MKGIFAHRSVFFQIGILIILLLTGYFTASLLTIPLLLLSGNAFTTPLMEQPVSVILTIQFISAIFMFLFPAIGTAWLCSNQPYLFLQIKTIHIRFRLLFLVTISMFLIFPIVSLTGYYNSLVTFPEWMAPLEVWMRSTEELAAEMTVKMLSEKGILAWLINFIVIAVIAGVTEEFFFRGALFSILRKGIRSHHVVIWTVAVIFSIIHFQFYGFIPRVILGAYLGYLLYWTKNIWIPVFAHFFNNAVVMIGMSSNSLKDNAFFAETIPENDLRWFTFTAIFCLLFFLVCAKIIRQISRKEEIFE